MQPKSKNFNYLRTLMHLVIKQGFVELYTQRLIEGNIYRLKLFRLKLSRLKLSSLRPIGSGSNS